MTKTSASSGGPFRQRRLFLPKREVAFLYKRVFLLYNKVFLFGRIAATGGCVLCAGFPSLSATRLFLFGRRAAGRRMHRLPLRSASTCREATCFIIQTGWHYPSWTPVRRKTRCAARESETQKTQQSQKRAQKGDFGNSRDKNKQDCVSLRVFDSRVKQKTLCCS